MQEIINYQTRKEEIRKRLMQTSENFVYIGYQLKQVHENREYEQDGYESLIEFAEKEYGLTKDDTYRFIRINSRFSVGGNSPELDLNYKGIGQSKLSEMLNLPDEDLPLITDRTARDDIRELNRFNRQQGIRDGQQEPGSKALQEIITEFFRPSENRDAGELHDRLQELLMIVNGEKEDPVLTKEEQLQECINPKGNSTFRRRMYMLFLYEARNGMKYKIFGRNENYPVSYLEFANMAHLIFTVLNQKKDGMDEWESFYGPIKPEKEEVSEPILLPEEPEQKPSTSLTGTVEKTKERPEKENSYPQKKEEKAEIAPAQLEEAKEETEAPNVECGEGIEGQEEVVELFPDITKEQEPIEEQQDAKLAEHQMEIEDYPEVIPDHYIKCHDGSEVVAPGQTRYEALTQAGTMEQMAGILQEIDNRDWILWLKEPSKQ